MTLIIFSSSTGPNKSTAILQVSDQHSRSSCCVLNLELVLSQDQCAKQINPLLPRPKYFHHHIGKKLPQLPKEQSPQDQGRI